MEHVLRMRPGAAGPAVIAVTVAALVAGCGGAGGDGSVAGNRTDAGANSAATVAAKSGEQLYQEKCVTCHGPGGRGIPNQGTKLAGTLMPKDAIVDAILNGKGKMPKTPNTSQAEAERMADYVLALPGA
jgi:mono/diheme cytochrome c family protein